MKNNEIIQHINEQKGVGELLEKYAITSLMNLLKTSREKQDFLIQIFWHWQQKTEAIAHFTKFNNQLFYIRTTDLVFQKITRPNIFDLFTILRLPPTLGNWFYKFGNEFFADDFENRNNLIIRLKVKLGEFFIDHKRNLYFEKDGEITCLPMRRYENPTELSEKILGNDLILYLKDEKCPLWIQPLHFNLDHETEFPKLNIIFRQWANFDPEAEKMLWTIIGHLLMIRNNLGGIFFLIGLGANGKTKFIELIANLLGLDNVNLAGNPAFLDQNSFETYNNMKGYKLMCYQELQRDLSNEATTFLKQATDPIQQITLKIKYQENERLQVPQNHIFSSNFETAITDNTEAVMRRFHWIPFEANFVGKNQNLKIDENILNELFTNEKFLNAVKQRAIKAYFANGKRMFFTEKARQLKWRLTLKRTEQFLLDWIEGFTADDIYYILNKGTEMKLDDIYNIYREWIRRNGYRPLGSRNMKWELESQRVSKEFKFIRHRTKGHIWIYDKDDHIE